MIQELVDFGKRVTSGKNRALKEENYSITLVIDEDGQYQQFIIGERLSVEAEIITAKKGKARFLLDKCEEVLGVSIDVGKLDVFLKNLELFKNVQAFNPVFKFYDKQNENGLRKAVTEYLNLDEEEKNGNMTFMVKSSLLLTNEDVHKVINNQIDVQNTKKSNSLSLKDASFTICIVINEKGEFQNFLVGEKQIVSTCAISTTKKEKYLLLGRDEDVLGITENGVEKKHHLFLDKLLQYKEELPIIEPVFKFYEEKNLNGRKKAIVEFVSRFTKDVIGENITFMVKGGPILLNTDEVKTAITKHFLKNEQRLLNGTACSICGKSSSPVLDAPHGYIKFKRRFVKKDGTVAQVAMGHPTGQNTLISYNEKVFESYGLIGNLNSSICVECARNYVEALNFLESKGNKTEKKYFEYKYRVDLSDSTIVLFWTRVDVANVSPFKAFDAPDSSYVRKLFESAWNGDVKLGPTVDKNMFYSLTLTPAARTIVRDWTAISLDEYKKNLAEWFRDIEIVDSSGILYYSPLRLLINASQRDMKNGEKTKVDLDSKTRIGTILWNAAIKGHSYKVPLEVLQYVLNRLWKKEKLSKERAALIKLIINRNINKKMKSTLDEANTSVAYLCGRLFAVIELMQWKAIGNVNSSVKDRFFTAAASQPAYIFGTLLTKNVPVYQHKIGGYLAKELKELAGAISEHGNFPQRFTTIEQGEFALGYYFQRTRRTIEKEDNINL